jgi:hypothetical protein
MSNIRVLSLDDDNHTPSFHAENTSHWHDANHFIKYLTSHHTVIIPYEVRQVHLIDLEVEDPDLDIDHIFDIVYFNGRGYSLEEYQEAFDILWKMSEDI